MKIKIKNDDKTNNETNYLLCILHVLANEKLLFLSNIYQAANLTTAAPAMTDKIL